MENLNKENFFDRMTALYPGGMQVFHGYVDAYKKQVNWDDLFNSNYQNAEGKNAPAPKFHEIPYEMQIGILLKFVSEVFQDEEGIYLGPNKAMPSIETTLQKLEAIVRSRTRFNSAN